MNILKLSLEELIALRKNYGLVETLDRDTAEGRCSLEKIHIFDQIMETIIRDNGSLGFFHLNSRWIDTPESFVDLAKEVFSDLSIDVNYSHNSYCSGLDRYFFYFFGK